MRPLAGGPEECTRRLGGAEAGWGRGSHYKGKEKACFRKGRLPLGCPPSPPGDGVPGPNLGVEAGAAIRVGVVLGGAPLGASRWGLLLLLTNSLKYIPTQPPNL